MRLLFICKDYGELVDLLLLHGVHNCSGFTGSGLIVHRDLHAQVEYQIKEEELFNSIPLKFHSSSPHIMLYEACLNRPEKTGMSLLSYQKRIEKLYFVILVLPL